MENKKIEISILFQEKFVGIISRRLFETLAFRMEKLKIISKNWHNLKKKTENFNLNAGLDFCRCELENRSET